jgi:hypothetical protein
MLYDQPSLRASLAIFEPENNWIQRGFTVYAPIANLAALNLNIVRTGGNVVNEASGNTWLDDFIYDWTTGVFPLVPAPGGLKAATRRGQKFRRRFLAQLD